MTQYYVNSITMRKLIEDDAWRAKFPELAGRVMPLHEYAQKVPGCKECQWGTAMFNTLVNELKNNPLFLTKFLADRKADQVKFMKDGRFVVLPVLPKQPV